MHETACTPSHSLAHDTACTPSHSLARPRTPLHGLAHPRTPSKKGVDRYLYYYFEVFEENEEESKGSFKGPLETVARNCVDYCKSNDITNPVEILRYVQSCIVK